MAKRIEQDGKIFRVRRGKLVEIPSKWVGQTVHAQTKKKRQPVSWRQPRHSEQNASKLVRAELGW